jgi:hypothetical protein
MSQRSLWQTIYIVEKLAVIERFAFDELREADTNFQEIASHVPFLALLMQSLKALFQGDRNGVCHRFARLFRNGSRQLIGFFVFDVQAHGLPLYKLVYHGSFMGVEENRGKIGAPNFGLDK